IADPEQQRQQLGKLKTQSERLTQLFDELLTMTRLDSEVDPINLEPVDLNQLVCALVDREKPAAQVKYQTIAYTPVPELPLLARDDASLRRALTALLNNAIIYTPQRGTISLRTRQEADTILIELQDSGIGISQEALPHIFDRLYRADEARSTHSGGMGL